MGDKRKENHRVEKRKSSKRRENCLLERSKQVAKGRILCFRGGKLEEVLNAGNYKKIIPTAENLGEALAFVKKIYPSTEGTFTAYEFELE